MAEARRKKGRPPKFVRLNEREIHGLSLHSSSGRYYATFSKPRVYFCGEPKLAVKDFLLWQARNGDKRISVGHTIDDPDDPKVEREIDQSLSRGEDAVIDITEEGSLFFGSKVAADDFWEKVRELLLEDPMLAAEMTGIERLAYLQHMEPPLPSRSLKEIGNLYLNDKKNELTSKEWKNSSTWWDEFCRITDAETVSDLSHEHFRKYRQAVQDHQKELERSNSYTRSRFGKIKAILNYALSGEMVLGSDDRARLHFRALLKPPAKPTPNPVDLTKNELQSVLKFADKWEEALILVAINCAYYPGDCSKLRWDMIDFPKNTIRLDRTKSTGRAGRSIPRVAVLWKRTLMALNSIRNGHAHVFVSSVGRPVHVETIRKKWNALCEQAGVNRNLTFANLRDSALTAASASEDPAVPMQQVRALAGHVAPGVDDHYIRRYPRFVETACKAIERHYFGQAKSES
ncbi:MAG: tyrosine-type recombinase/integrase [Planctomycetes bacterium]|nr:tyrosine-type recombinase/integrase [Planctomycetota bacterium]